MKQVLIGTAVTLAACAITATNASAQDLQSEIRAEVDRFVAAVNAGDSEALAALYIGEPAVASVGDGQITRGWQSVAELLEDLYGQLGRISMSADSVTVMELGEDAAIAFFRYRWTFGPDPPQSFTGAMTIVFQRTGDGWRVVHDHTSTLLSEAAATPSVVPLTDSGPPRPVRQTSTCTISRIVDGDTIECSGVGRIRLIGMDTPEMSQEP